MDDYHRGLKDAERHAERTNPDWKRQTFGPLLWIGIPLVGLAVILRGGMDGTKLSSIFTRRAGPKKEPANPFKDMMESMMPIKKRDFRVNVSGITFNDVIGIPEAKEQVSQYIHFLREPEKFTRLGARIPRGCLLSGEPGTGKTLLAKAAAGEADVPFFSCSGADFLELAVGSGPKRIRELFEQARETAPCIIFIDELDAIGSREGRGGSMAGEENRTINQLLAELDGMGIVSDPNTTNDKETEDSSATPSQLPPPPPPVVVLAATNLLDNIDRALLREGRFDRKIPVDMPDAEARRELFSHYLGKVVTGDPKGCLKVGEQEAAEADLNVSNEEWAKKLAELTPGVASATVATVVNEAALQCAVAGDKRVTYEALVAATNDTLIGKRQRSRMTLDAKNRTALHEAGHALVGWMLPQQTETIQVSIEPRGNALGFTQRKGTEFHEFQTTSKLFTDLCVLYGGRVAEECFYGSISAGAQDDLQRVTELALQKILVYGFSGGAGRNDANMRPQLPSGLLVHDPRRAVGRTGRAFVTFSEEAHQKAEEEAKLLCSWAQAMAMKLVTKNKDKVQKLANALVENSTLTAQEIADIYGPRPKEPSRETIQKHLDKKYASALKPLT